MHLQPTISVIMPFYNASNYLAEAVESILNQTYENFEFLIFDDGSTDGGANQLNTYTDERIRLFSNSHRGKFVNLNQGLAQARGEFIAFMDADDISKPHRFEMQLNYFNINPAVQVLGSAVDMFENQNEATHFFPLGHKQIKAELLFSCSLNHPSTMVRRNFITDNALSYQPQFPHCEDYGFWSHAICLGEFANMEESLLRYRLHPAQISRSDIVQIYVQKIRHNLLSELLPDATEEDYLGQDFLYQRKPVSDWELKICLQTIKRIFDANVTRKIYDEDVLAVILHQRYLSLLK